ncbi:MAG: methylmalonyl-CoA mutase family protein, partial [Bacilli bacterium]
MSDFEKQFQDWEMKTKELLSKYPEMKQRFQTSSEIDIDRVYTSLRLNKRDEELPGEFPYTRGIQPTMYRAKHWTMRQYAGFGS